MVVKNQYSLPTSSFHRQVLKLRGMISRFLALSVNFPWTEKAARLVSFLKQKNKT